MIEVRNLVKKYGNHTAVNNLSFTVEDGQVYGFLGPNGAGKSTTMNMIIGYLSSTEGEIIINGHDIFEEPEEAKKCIGYLPEIPPLYLDMTVREYLMFVADVKKVPKKERAEMIEKIMRMTGIVDVQNRLIKQLSKGYRQRVGMAQAIVGFPNIIILDEPTVGLDPKQIIEVRDLIKKLSKNHTIILSSHIMQEISAVCDRILIINKGELVAEGTPEELAEMAQGAQEVHLVAKGSKEQVEEILSTSKNIFKKEYKKAEEEGTTSVVVYAERQKDIRESLFRSFAKKDVPLLSMTAYTKSLEDIFLEVTENTASVNNASASATDENEQSPKVQEEEKAVKEESEE